MLRRGSFCGADAMYNASKSDETERFCNEVAGEFLVPAAQLKSVAAKYPVSTDTGIVSSDLQAISDTFKVSQEVVLLRLLKLEMISSDFYQKKRKQLLLAYKNMAKKGGGPVAQDIKTLSRMGTRFASLILDAADSEKITISRASDYLGVRVRYLNTLRDRIERQKAGDAEA
jgi:Zn-dependent peptidase ImmA (M78 family)